MRAVTSKAKFSDLTRELHEHLTTTENKQGALSKYANTYATTSMSQYVGENNRLLTNDLGLEWFEYVGSNIETTREFCDHLTEKRYVHKSEIKTILKGEIDGYQCEIYEKTGLPKGMIEGTNEQNFQVNCGGWNCRHQLVPVAKEAVPKELRDKIKEIRKAEREQFFEKAKNEKPIQKQIIKGNKKINISVSYNTKLSYKHIYTDIIRGRTKGVFSIDDIEKIGEYFRDSKYDGHSILTKKRKDDFKHFYYFTKTIDGKKITFNVGKKVRTKRNKTEIQFLLYSIT